MNTDFEDRLREMMAAEQPSVVVDEHAVLARGRSSVRIRHAGQAVLGVAILAAAIPAAILLARQPTSDVIAPVPSPAASATASMPAEILGSLTWRLSAETGEWAGTAPVITLAADGGNLIQGSLGCGTYAGQIPQRGVDWRIEARVATTHSCPYQVNARDSRYLDTLNAVTTYEYSSDPDRLVLSGPGGRLVFEPISDSVTWQVTRLGGAPRQDSGLTLVIRGGSVRGGTICVDYTADLSRNGDAWSVTNRQNVRGTEVPCPLQSSNDMNRYFDLLDQVTHATVSVDQLVLTGPNGTLTFAIKS